MAFTAYLERGRAAKRAAQQVRFFLASHKVPVYPILDLELLIMT